MASQVAQWKRVHLPSRYRFNPWIGKEMATYLVPLPEKFHGQSFLEGYSPWVHKSQTLLSN